MARIVATGADTYQYYDEEEESPYPGERSHPHRQGTPLYTSGTGKNQFGRDYYTEEDEADQTPWDVDEINRGRGSGRRYTTDGSYTGAASQRSRGGSRYSDDDEYGRMYTSRGGGTRSRGNTESQWQGTRYTDTDSDGWGARSYGQPAGSDWYSEGDEDTPDYRGAPYSHDYSASVEPEVQVVAQDRVAERRALDRSVNYGDSNVGNVGQMMGVGSGASAQRLDPEVIEYRPEQVGEPQVEYTDRRLDPEVIEYRPEQVGEPQVEYTDDYYGNGRAMSNEQAQRYKESRERSRGNPIIVVTDARQVQELFAGGLERWR
jgi:hypothetical protein